MATKVREELVGKRFLCVCARDVGGASGTPVADRKLKLSRISDWHWKGGVIRSASSVNDQDTDLQVGIKNMVKKLVNYLSIVTSTMYHR